MSTHEPKLPLKAKLISRIGGKALYEIDGKKTVFDSATGDMHEATEVELTIFSTSGTKPSGHNPEWADEKLARFIGKNVSSFKTLNDFEVKASPRAAKAKEEEISFPLISPEFSNWAKNWKEGNPLPVVPPGLEIQLHSSFEIPQYAQEQRPPSTKEIVDELLDGLGLPLKNPNSKKKTKSDEIAELEEKGLLGRELRDMSQSLLSIAARARGLWVDKLNKLRCGPGSPRANWFTNIFGVNCNVPLSPGEATSDAARAAVRGVSEAGQTARSVATSAATAGRATSEAIGDLRSVANEKYNTNPADPFHFDTIDPTPLDTSGTGAMGRLVSIMGRIGTAMSPRRTAERGNIHRANSKRKQAEFEQNWWNNPKYSGLSDSDKIAAILDDMLSDNQNLLPGQQPATLLRGPAFVRAQASPVRGSDYAPALRDDGTPKTLWEQIRDDMTSFEALGFLPTEREKKEILKNFDKFMISVAKEIATGKENSYAINMLRSIRPQTQNEQSGFGDSMVLARVNGIGFPLRPSGADLSAMTFSINDDTAGTIPGWLFEARQNLISNNGNLPLFGELAINPRALTSEGWRGFYEEMAPNHLSIGKPQTQDQWFDYLAEHELNHLNDFTSKLRQRFDKTIDEWKSMIDQQFTPTGNPITLDDANPNAPLGKAYQQLKASLQGANHQRQEKLMAQFYMTQIAFREDLAQRVAAMLQSYGGHSKQSTKELIEDVVEELRNRGWDPDSQEFSLFSDVFEYMINQIPSGQPGVSAFLTTPTGIFVSQEKRAVINSLIGALYATENPIEQAAELRTLLQNVGYDQVMKYINSNENLFGLTHKEFESILISFFGEEELEMLRRGVGRNPILPKGNQTGRINIPGSVPGNSSSNPPSGRPLVPMSGIKSLLGRQKPNTKINNNPKYGVLTGSVNSHYNDKVEALLNSVSSRKARLFGEEIFNFDESDEAYSEKALGPGIGRPKRNMNPFTAIDANNNGMVLEGIRSVRGGEGVPDPTPSGVGMMRGQQTNRSRRSDITKIPMNRAMRRERKRRTGMPRRSSTVGKNPFNERSFSRHGGVGAMSIFEKFNFQRSPDNSWMSDPVVAKMEIEAQKSFVDSELNSPSPQTIRDIYTGLAEISSKVNQANGDESFSIDDYYWTLSASPDAENTFGGRYNGLDTPLSPTEKGLYYSLAYHALKYPRAFQHVNLVISSQNMPDQPSVSSAGGSTTVFPPYFQVSRGFKFGPGAPPGARILPLGESQVVGFNPSLPNDISTTVAAINPKFRDSQINIVVEFPSFPYEFEKLPQFAIDDGNGNVMHISPEYEHAKDSLLRSVMELFFDGNNSGYLDSVPITIILPMIEAAQDDYERAIEKARNNPSKRGSIMARAIDRAEENIKDLSESLMMMIGHHEFGHSLNAIGDAKSSPSYARSVQTARSGLNSMEEFLRDVSAFQEMQNDPNHFLNKPFGEVFAAEWMQEHIAVILSNSHQLSEIMNHVQEETEKLNLLTAVLGQASGMTQQVVESNPQILRNMENLAETMLAGSGSSLAEQGYDATRPAWSRFRYLGNRLSEIGRLSNRNVMFLASRQSEIQNYLAGMPDVLAWLGNQSWDVDGWQQNFSLARRQMIENNPDALEEFMEVAAKNFRGKQVWLDQNGKFNWHNYVKDVMAKREGMSGSYGMQLVNSILNSINNNGWKGMDDSRMSNMIDISRRLSTYAGPAIYNQIIPKVKGWPGSNDETYAELHLAMLMRRAATLAHYTPEEKALLMELHKNMIDRAEQMFSRMRTTRNNP